MPTPEDHEWGRPVWSNEVTKHRPVTKQTATWEDVVKSTDTQGGKGSSSAKYGPYPSVTVEMIERLEMEIVRSLENELPRQKPHVRSFWRKMDFVIGAANGEETCFIYVEWHLNGAVHGRPMTESDLRKKGMSS